MTTDHAKTDQPITVRPLGYADLPQVIALERRAFPTPWSLAMFVLELSKPSGICLAASAGEGLAGYLVCSRSVAPTFTGDLAPSLPRPVWPGV